MQQEYLSDQSLSLASALAREALLNSLPNPQECHHDFSFTFLRHIEKIRKSLLRRRFMKTLTKWVAAIILMFLISTSVLFITNTQARATIIGWLNNVFDYISEYIHIAPYQSAAYLPEYYIDHMPDGYDLVDETSSNTRHSAFYYNPYLKDGIALEYYLPSEYVNIQIFDPSQKPVSKQVFVNDIIATLYLDGTTDILNLVWIEPTQNILFILSSTLDESTIISLAENIVLKN